MKKALTAARLSPKPMNPTKKGADLHEHPDKSKL
jgi:hypothetical protein